MSTNRFCRLAFPLFVILVETSLAAASITDQIKWPPGQAPAGETNGPDTLDDIWQGLFNAWALDPNGDEDKDGCSNIVESIAGTDPHAASDCFRIGNLSIVGNTVVFSTKAEAGKKYKVLSSSAPNGPTWTVETLQTPVVGDEYIPEADQEEVFLTVTKAVGSRLFYKLETSDVSSSGDGVSDWVKRKLGLNPMAADSNGDGVSDADEITQELQTPDVVTVGAETSIVSEDGGPPGQITLSRGRSLLGVTVFYSLGGTATAGADFASLAGAAHFAPGEREARIMISPNADGTLEGGESVTVTLTGAVSDTSTPLEIGESNEATVIINNSTAPGGTGLLAQYYDTASSTYTNSANFNASQLKITRIDPVVDHDWLYGTPNGNTYLTDDDNYSVSWEGYLHPTTAGTYSFQLEADDKARVFLDPNDGGGYRQILENGWDTPATGGFKQSSTFTFSVPAAPANRHRMRVEFVETTGDATCRVQWKVNSANYTNIPSTNVYTTNSGSTTGWNANFYDGTNFDTLKRTQIDSAITNGNNGIWGSGTPDTSLMHRDYFSIRWTGQVQPQFTEEHTFVVHADNGCRMWINGEEQEFRTATSSNVGSSTYSYDGSTGDAVINYTNSAIVPDSFAVGDIARLDPTSGNLSGLGTLDYVITAATATTFTVNFGAGAFASGPGNMNIDSLNRQLKPWASMGAERFVRLPVVGGTRYDIKLEYYETTSLARCRLFWYSPSQPRQIIPTERLYPATNTPAPAAHISETSAAALVGGSFSVPVSGSNGASVSLSGNPAWLTFSNGVLSGTPPSGSAGDYQIVITVTNAAGASTSVLDLHVEDTGGVIEREHWNGVPGTSVANVPADEAPTGVSSLTTLAAPTDFGDDYAARIRGYITAPVTGNYYFWIAASDAAELWISNDDEPVNAFKRAWVTHGTAPQEWNNASETHQRSAWLALEQGRRYYIEILHKAGAGGGDNLAVGWAKPGAAGTAPTEIVPGHVLSPYAAPAPGSTPGTLYVATMLAQNGAVTSGVGSATLRLSEDEDTVIMNYSHAGLTGPITSQHIHTDPYLSKPSTIVYDIDTPDNPGDGLQPDGSHLWTITPVGTLSKADIIEIIKQGKAYINLHTALYPAGEIRGNFTLANGSRSFSPPPPPPAWTDDHDTDVGAVRFLTQATFGPNIDDIAALKAMPGYEAWIDDQFTKPASLQLPEVYRAEFANAQGGAFSRLLTFNAWWKNSISGDDQLRQRIAFALSEIHVVSAQGPLLNNARALSYFYDRLAENAFGSFRDILKDTTLTPSMGRYLDMLRNDKPDLSLGRIPNENYAREIKQLFSVGLYRMWPDGSLILNSKDAPIDTYSQREIVGFAHVFTGWDYGYDGAYRTALNAPAEWTRQMREVPARHFTGPKRLLNNEVLPGLQTLGGRPLDPYALHNSMTYNDPAYQTLPAQELEAAHEQLFNHPNVGPFICRQLIQRLVTSHPSRDYLYRVVQKFNDNGSGVRGDMKAVIKAILLDYEARSSAEAAKPAFGKQREPLLRVAAAGRAFRPDTFSGSYSQNGTRTINITTTTPHGLASGNQVFLDFDSGSPAPWSGAYSISSVTTSGFNITAQGWATSSTSSGYRIPANSTTCTITMNNHWLQTGHQVFVDFTSGSANGVPGLDGVVYTLTSASAQTGTNGTFTFEIDPAHVSASTRTGSAMIPRFTPGSYTSASSGLPAPNDRRVTMDTNFDHHLNVGDQVQLNFTAGNPQPVDRVVTVESVVDLNTYTFLAPAAGTNLGSNQGNNGVYQFPLVPQPLVRSGTFSSRPSTFNMGDTDADIDQSPVNSATVFNYFLPDFKNPGALAAQGITTPEFQTTAETTVIRQANFLHSGLFNPNTTNGASAFKNGSNALVLNYSRWMGNATDQGFGAGPQTGQAWTSNANLPTLITHMNTLLTAGQLSAAARAVIQNFLAQPLAAISTGSPCTVTTVGEHGFSTGESVTISGVSNGGLSPTLNNTSAVYTVTVTGPTTFTLPVSCSSSPNAAGLANAHVSAFTYNNVSPSTAQKRDRLRAIIHLILSSPDFTIQR